MNTAEGEATAYFILGTVGFMVGPIMFLSGIVVTAAGLSGEGSAVLGVLLIFASAFVTWAANQSLNQSFKIQADEAQARREQWSREAEARRRRIYL